jgi:hypothetical protein
MATAPTAQESPVQTCARLLRELHTLIAAGRGDTDEAEVIRDTMDPLWGLMTKRERSRITGLSEDLHMLAAGGAKKADMTPEELERWRAEAKEAVTQLLAGDADAALTFLRRPSPTALSPKVIPFLQARAWESLGDPEVALMFLKEAERHDPDLAAFVLAERQGPGTKLEPHEATSHNGGAAERWGKALEQVLARLP